MTLPLKPPLHHARPLFVLLTTLTMLGPALAQSVSYYVLQPMTVLGGAPDSLLMQSSFIDVPAGAELSVHLVKGHQIVATSRLEFTTPYKSSSVFPTQIASFLSSGSSTVPGEPVAGARLFSGITDLSLIAAAPTQYQFLWSLTQGIVAAPGQAIITGGSQTVNFVTLKGLTAAASRQSDQKPGSVLFYHRYLSTIGNPNGNNTTISLTNTSPTLSTKVRMFFISAADCSSFEQAVCLLPQQTTTFRMSDFDPGTTGYVVAVACDSQGNPTQFNWLIGNAQLRQTSPLTSQFYDATLSALAVAKRELGSVSATNNVAEMVFDDAMYDSLPSQLAADNVPSQGTTASNGNATVLSLYRPVSNLAGGGTSAPLTYTINNNTGQSTTGSQTIGCYADLRLSSLRLNPAVATILSLGKVGWIRISATDSGALLGAQFNSGQYASGANVRAVTYSPDFRISIPIKAPGC
jgi:hypothetical protein